MSARVNNWGPGDRSRLYRDVGNGRIAGVCAGLGNYLQIKPKFVRIAVILLGIFVFPSLLPLIVGYVLLAIFLPVTGGYATPAAAFGPTGNPPPTDVFASLQSRLRSLDGRLAAMEGHVTSSEFALRQKFREL